jgi:hypothetical protein
MHEQEGMVVDGIDIQGHYNLKNMQDIPYTCWKPNLGIILRTLLAYELGIFCNMSIVNKFFFYGKLIGPDIKINVHKETQSSWFYFQYKFPKYEVQSGG